MKRNWLFLSPKTETENLNVEQVNSGFVGCPYRGRNCKRQLTVIHKHYLNSSKYQKEKKFQLAIKFLKSAYYKTDELKHSTCAKCIALFRATITDSMEELQKELHKLNHGIFRKNRYDDVYTEAQNALRDFYRNN